MSIWVEVTDCSYCEQMPREHLEVEEEYLKNE